MIRRVTNLLAALSIALPGATCARAQHSTPGEFTLKSTINALSGGKVPDDSADHRNQVSVRVKSRGCPDLVVILSGMGVPQDGVADLVEGSTFAYGEFRLKFDGDALPSDDDCVYDFEISYSFRLELQFQGKDRAVRGTAAPIKGTLQGKVVRRSSKTIACVVKNKFVEPEQGIAKVKLESAGEGAKALEIRCLPPPSALPGFELFPYSTNSNRGYFAAFLQASGS